MFARNALFARLAASASSFAARSWISFSSSSVMSSRLTSAARVLHARAQHRRAVDPKRSPAAARGDEIERLVAQGLAFFDRCAPRQRAFPRRAGAPSRSHQARLAAGLPMRASALDADDLRERAVAKHDEALRIDDQQSLGERVQSGAHAAGDRSRRIEMAQHAPQVPVEDDEAHDQQKRAELHARIEDDAPASPNGPAGTNLSSAVPQRWRPSNIGTWSCSSVDCSASRCSIASRAPPTLADELAFRVAQADRLDVAIALKGELEKIAERCAVLAREQYRGADRDRFRDRCPARAQRLLAVRHEARKHREHVHAEKERAQPEGEIEARREFLHALALRRGRGGRRHCAPFACARKVFRSGRRPRSRPRAR